MSFRPARPPSSEPPRVAAARALAPPARAGFFADFTGPLTGPRLAVLLSVFAAVWLGLLWSTSNVAPSDNLEQLVWLGSLEWGYYKHPPLPTWLIGAAAKCFGVSEGLSYVVGATCTLGALALFWRLMRELRGPSYATLALLAALCVTFYTGRLYYYNHNVVMMLWVVLCASLAWRLTQRPSLGAWLAMGVVIGLGMLTKYQMVIAVVCVALWGLRLRWWANPLHRRGALLAAVAGLLVFAPHLNWLIEHDWLPLRYAEQSSIGAAIPLARRPLHALAWVGDWLFNRTLPAWILLLAASWWAMRGAPQAEPGAQQSALATDRQVREFLLSWGVVPLGFMATMGLLGGVHLQMQWGTAFMLWTVPAMMELARRAAVWTSPAAVRAAWGVFVLVQATLLLQYWMASPAGMPGFKAHHFNHFPADRLAKSIAGNARAELGGPIDIISGTYDVAEAIALRLPERPRVLIFGETRYSPWIAPEELATARIMEVFPARELPPGAQWATAGWAWRPGVSEKSRLKVIDWLRMRRESPAESAADRRADEPPG